MIALFLIAIGVFSNSNKLLNFMALRLGIALLIFSNQSLIFNSFLLIDVYRYSLIVLSIWIIMLILVSYKSFPFIAISIERVFIALLLNLIVIFSVESFLLFYISFEFVVVPTFVLILGWGVSQERLQAAIFMFIYTVVSSLPFLIFIITIQSQGYRLNFIFRIFNDALAINSFIWWRIIILVFIVKLPIFMVHLWLPKAHVEAPLSGSIILAGVLLKLGGYGIFKIFRVIKNSSIKIRGPGISLAMWGSLAMCIVCLTQVDMKRLIAYSSIVHIGPILISIFSIYWLGWLGAMIVIISHGITSSGIFFLMNSMYERIGRRRSVIVKGVLKFFPFVSFFWFFIAACNISVPPTLNFYSEILVIFRVLGLRNILFILMALTFFLVGVYCVFFYISCNHGDHLSMYFRNLWFSSNETLVRIMHRTPLLVLILRYSTFL